MRMLPKEFIEKYAPFAKETQTQYKVPASVTLAQAILESGWGDKAEGNNFFGIKNFSTLAKKIREVLWAGKTYDGPLTDDMQLWWTREVINGKSIRVQDVFMKYPTVTDGFIDHAKFFIKNSRYSKAFETANGFYFATEIAKAGYATDPNYATTLHLLMRKYNLTQFDQ